MTEDSSQENIQKTESKKDKIANLTKKKRFIFSVIAIFVLSILAWLYFTSFETTDDAFVEGHVIQISPKVSGIIEKL